MYDKLNLLSSGHAYDNDQYILEKSKMEEAKAHADEIHQSILATDNNNANDEDNIVHVEAVEAAPSISTIDGKIISSISTIDQPSPTLFPSIQEVEKSVEQQDAEYEKEDDIKSRPKPTTMEAMIWNGTLKNHFYLARMELFSFVFSSFHGFIVISFLNA